MRRAVASRGPPLGPLFPILESSLVSACSVLVPGAELWRQSNARARLDGMQQWSQRDCPKARETGAGGQGQGGTLDVPSAAPQPIPNTLTRTERGEGGSQCLPLPPLLPSHAIVAPFGARVGGGARRAAGLGPSPSLSSSVPAATPVPAGWMPADRSRVHVATAAGHSPQDPPSPTSITWQSRRAACPLRGEHHRHRWEGEGNPGPAESLAWLGACIHTELALSRGAGGWPRSEPSCHVLPFWSCPGPLMMFDSFKGLK